RLGAGAHGQRARAPALSLPQLSARGRERIRRAGRAALRSRRHARQSGGPVARRAHLCPLEGAVGDAAECRSRVRSLLRCASGMARREPGASPRDPRLSTQPTNEILPWEQGSATVPHRLVSGARAPLSPERQQPGSGGHRVNQVEVAVIGTGWCGGIGAEPLPRSALVDKLHICEIRPDRLAEVKALTKPATATLDYQDIVKNPNISVVYVCTTPESNHFPITRDCLKAGKHVLLEKPIAMELWQADERITLAGRAGVKFTIGYSQRFNPKIAFAKKKITDGTLGKMVSVLVSRHVTRNLGKKITGRTKLSPAAMESTHDLDFVFW